MNGAPDDDQNLRAYLLGIVPRVQSYAIEQRALDDPEFREALFALEDELIDDYLRGHLPAHEVQAFEERFLRSPEKLRKVELAAALMRSYSRPAGFKGLLVRFRPWSLQGTLVLGAILVAVALGLVQLIRFNSRAAPASHAAVPDPKKRGGPSSAEKQIFTIVLAPGIVRGSEKQKTFEIPVSIDAVRFRLQLSEIQPDWLYEAEMRTLEGEEIARQRAFPASSSVEPAVDLTVPASSLASRDYLILLRGVPPKSSSRQMGSYSFRLSRP